MGRKQAKETAVEAKVEAGSAVSMRPIDVIRSAFSQQLKRYVATEFPNPQTGEPLELYFGPLTISDVEAVREEGSESWSPEHRSLRLLIHKARLADGTPAFLPGDLHFLKSEATFDAMQRMTRFMYSVSNVTNDEAEDAIKNTGGSASS